MKTLHLPFTVNNGYSFTKRNTPRELYQDQSMKARVDNLKSQIEYLPRHKWTKAVRFTNPYELVCKKYPRKISRAYFKMAEIMSDFDLKFENIEKIKTLHLCEGPGGFIQALVELRKYQNKSLDWVGITLKNETDDKNIPDFELDISKMGGVTYGSDGTGDLTNVDNIKHLKNMFDSNKANLITADGGFDVSEDHCSQESQSYKLMLCQVVSALSTQGYKGSFIMKVFDCYSNEMTELLYILSHHYSNVSITKPYSSRPCNSEKYVVCTGFRGVTNIELDNLYEYINDYQSMSLTSQPNALFLDILSDMNMKFSMVQQGSLENTLTFANRTGWVVKPADMSRWFIDKYLI